MDRGTNLEQQQNFIAQIGKAVYEDMTSRYGIPK